MLGIADSIIGVAGKVLDKGIESITIKVQSAAELQ